MDTPREWFSLSEVVQRYGISRRMLWRWIRNGRLQAAQPSRKVLIKRENIEAILEHSRIEPDLAMLRLHSQQKLVNDAIAVLRATRGEQRE